MKHSRCLRLVKNSLLILTTTLGTAANAQSVSTMEELIPRIQALSTEPLVKHCVVNAPESAAAVQAGYSNFNTQFAVASKTWLATLDPKASTPLPPDSEQLLQDMPAKLLESIKQIDAATFCPILAARLSKVTSDSLVKTLQKAYARYEEMAQKERAPSATK